MIVFIVLIIASLATAAWLAMEPSLIRRRRRRLISAATPDQWPAWIARHVPVFGRLPDDLRERVLGLARIFVNDKRFVGCNGLTVTDEMRVVIAFEASLLVVNRPGVPLDDFYDELESILIYPAAFLVEETRHLGHGLVTTGRRALSGQAWEARRMILSWDDIEHPHAAGNVVLHEFAHYLDMENDSMDGAPALQNAPAYARWSQAFWEEYRRLHDDLQAGRPTVLDPYAATEPAEFFAVVTEVFFERPGPLLAEHPGLYEQLKSYYRLDPVTWA
jgi:Mlc titration factor MtfA (ptsG expression regulator)